MGRSASGVKGMSLKEDECIVGMAVVDENAQDILVVTEKGFGKRSNVDEYRVQGRGGQGVKTVNITNKNGKLIGLRNVSENEDLIITTDKGIIIRMHVSDISQTSRNTQGVILIRLKDEQKIATIAVVEKQNDSEVNIVEE